MARKARIDAPGALHHVICRGIERRKIFDDDADRDNLVERLGTVLKEMSTPCYGWALLSNHFHSVTTPVAPLAEQRRIVSEVEKLKIQIGDAQAVIDAAPARKEAVMKRSL